MNTSSVRAGQETRGFTLIEILVVIGIIAILAAIVIVAINPSRQFGQANDASRTSGVSAILNAIGQNIADNKGTFKCGVSLPSTATDIASSGGVDIRTCLVPTYMPELPVDPKTGTAWNGTSYDTKYTVMQDSNGRVTVSATPDTPGTTISVTR